MRVALLTTFAASKKEPLAVLLKRIHAAFVESGQGEPSVRFLFSDAPVPGGVSSVDRVMKRFPSLERFVVAAAALPGAPAIRQITNGVASPAAGEAVDFETLLTIAAGVPKSFPFHGVSVQFHGAAFGDVLPGGVMAPGIMVGDAWWVSGRMRSLSAMTIAEAEPGGKNLPSPPDAVANVLAACGKVKKTVQVPFPGSGGVGTATTSRTAGPNPEAARAVSDIVQDFKARFEEILDRAALPHDLPPAIEALKSTPLGEKTGPKKPVLVRAFKPMGYDCKAESGTFTLRRRTPGHLTVEISLDVGTWSRSITAAFRVHGLGFRATLLLPVSRRAMGNAQYPIGDSDRWQRIVDNLAALAAELDRSFVPAVEAAAGPGPEWYSPEN